MVFACVYNDRSKPRSNHWVFRSRLDFHHGVKVFTPGGRESFRHQMHLLVTRRLQDGLAGQFFLWGVLLGSEGTLHQIHVYPTSDVSSMFAATDINWFGFWSGGVDLQDPSSSKVCHSLLGAPRKL